MSFRDSTAHLLRALNPLYRNPIEVLPDAGHLQADRLMMGNPHVVTNAISKVLTTNEHFHTLADGMARNDPTFNMLLRTAVTGDSLLVNVYEIMPAPELVEGLSINTSQLRGERIELESFQRLGYYHHHFYVSYAKSGINGQPAVVVEGQTATAKTINGYYDPNEPKHSLTIPLTVETKQLLGLR